MKMTPTQINAKIAETQFMKQRIFEQIAEVDKNATYHAIPVDRSWRTAAFLRIAKINKELAALYVEKIEIRKEVDAKLAKKKAENIQKAEDAKRKKEEKFAAHLAREATYSQAFINAAKKLLPEESYRMLTDEALRSIGEPTHTEVRQAKAA